MPEPVFVIGCDECPICDEWPVFVRWGYVLRDVNSQQVPPPLLQRKRGLFSAGKQLVTIFEPDLSPLPLPSYRHQNATLTISELEVSYFIS